MLMPRFQVGGSFIKVKQGVLIFIATRRNKRRGSDLDHRKL
jgi:hypothetical protein